MLHRLLLLVITATALLSAETAPCRVFFVGNSVTDTVNYEALAQLATSRGIVQPWARQMIPGAPLSWIWRDDNGFVDPAYGPAKRALAEHPWDVVTVQPFDRQLDGDDECDLPTITQMIAVQLPKNPAVRFYVYQRWPRMVATDGMSLDFDKDDYDPKQGRLTVDLTRIQEWESLYGRTYTGGWDGTNETADYFTKLLTAVRVAHPQLTNPPQIIPVGDVMLALHQRMRAGTVPGRETIWTLYKDGIHLGVDGSYLVGCTFFATIHRQDPRGLPTAPYGVTDEPLARIIQEVVWEVVSKHPLAGLAK
jgi:hypothetical protein